MVWVMGIQGRLLSHTSYNTIFTRILRNELLNERLKFPILLVRMLYAGYDARYMEWYVG